MDPERPLAAEASVARRAECIGMCGEGEGAVVLGNHQHVLAIGGRRGSDVKRGGVRMTLPRGGVASGEAGGGRRGKEIVVRNFGRRHP